MTLESKDQNFLDKQEKPLDENDFPVVRGKDVKKVLAKFNTGEPLTEEDRYVLFLYDHQCHISHGKFDSLRVKAREAGGLSNYYEKETPRDEYGWRIPPVGSVKDIRRISYEDQPLTEKDMRTLERYEAQCTGSGVNAHRQPTYKLRIRVRQILRYPSSGNPEEGLTLITPTKAAIRARKKKGKKEKSEEEYEEHWQNFEESFYNGTVEDD